MMQRHHNQKWFTFIVMCTVCFFSSCSQNKSSFSKEDIEAQQAFIDLIDLTHHTIDKTVLIDSIRTMKLPAKEQVVTSYETGGYVDKHITISEEERRIYMYHDIIALINVKAKQCFLPSVDHNFNAGDFIYNIEHCLGGLYPKIKDDFWAKFTKGYPIDSRIFSEINTLLAPHGSEMGIVHLYDDQFYFIFFETKNKPKVYAIFDRLGLQIGDQNTFFEDFKRD